MNLCLISLTNENIYVFQGIGKKTDATIKQKDCKDPGFWRKAIVNHHFCVAATPPEGNKDML